MEKLFFLKYMIPTFGELHLLAAGFFALRSFGTSPKGAPKNDEQRIEQSSLSLTSNAFENNGMIPVRYTCEGENISPQLEISNVPERAVSLALIVHDDDAPVPGGWTHWIVFNIDPRISKIPIRSVPEGAIEGETSFGVTGWGGPCPPSGTHHYEFKLYALDSQLALDENSKKMDLLSAMEGHIISQTTLMGLYKKNN